jgi:hypothetical protein
VGHLGEVLDVGAGRVGIAQVQAAGGRTRRVPGKPRVFMLNLDFVGPYRAKCEAFAENGWEGFAIDGVATPTRDEVFA